MKASIVQYMALAGRFLLLALTIPALMACGGDSGGPRGSVSFSKDALLGQIGFVRNPETGQLVGPSANDPTRTVARSILIGAIVIRSRTIAQGPYSDRVPISDVEAQLEDDIINSGNLIKLFNLPTSDENVVIELPPPGAEKWQLAAAALTTQPQTAEDLAQTSIQDSIVYIGFGRNPNDIDPVTGLARAAFFRTGDEGQVFVLDGNGNPAGQVSSINLSLQRACLIPNIPPKGCAQYNVISTTNTSPVVSDAVEIISIEVNGVEKNPAFGAFPIIVRAGGVGTAEQAMLNIFSSIDNNVENVPFPGVRVFTTHILSPNNSACFTLVGSSPTLAVLKKAVTDGICTSESYFTPSKKPL